uniref:Uncharacterized protein n=1 Tax=Eutreptiella gymnastica TaxID=73025 RepID=A0A7S4LBE2_9EUGL
MPTTPLLCTCWCTHWHRPLVAGAPVAPTSSVESSTCGGMLARRANTPPVAPALDHHQLAGNRWSQWLILELLGPRVTGVKTHSTQQTQRESSPMLAPWLPRVIGRGDLRNGGAPGATRALAPAASLVTAVLPLLPLPIA